MGKKEEHFKVGDKDMCCEFCLKPTSTSKTGELVSDVEGCEIYAHKKCRERAEMLVKEIEWTEE